MEGVPRHGGTFHFFLHSIPRQTQGGGISKSRPESQSGEHRPGGGIPSTSMQHLSEALLDRRSGG